jgi:hypothetical protein
MANLYEAERADTKAAIEQDGAAGFIRRGTSDTPCSFLILSYTPFERDGALITYADQKFMVAALGLTDVPDNQQDKAVINDARPEFASSVGTYRIVSVTPFHPGGVAIYYELQVRKQNG